LSLRAFFSVITHSRAAGTSTVHFISATACGDRFAEMIILQDFGVLKVGQGLFVADSFMIL